MGSVPLTEIIAENGYSDGLYKISQDLDSMGLKGFAESIKECVSYIVVLERENKELKGRS